RDTYKPGHIERTRNTTSFEYDIRLDDGTLVEATSRFWHSVPSVLTRITGIPDLVSVETGKPIEAMPGFAFIDFYHVQGETVEIRWKKYRELYPAERWGTIWNYASSPDGLLNDMEKEACVVVEENIRLLHSEPV
ncbi:MAG TPA: hypothetical protein VEL31_11985, partial [Ktedonobacteraceae bacterium]|nr:hypothetical protein [Ktedonobacteraceae bacterium]